MASIRVGGVDIPLSQFPGGAAPQWLKDQADKTTQAAVGVQPEQSTPGSVVGHDAAKHPIVVQPDGSRRIDYSRVLTPQGTYTTAGGAAPPISGTSLASPLPSAPLAQPTGVGVTIGEYEDYRAVAEQALRSIGIVNADRFGFLSDADIDRFALAKMDVEAIVADYARRPEVQAINPGAELGLSREDYFAKREGHEEAFSQRFGKTSTLDETRRRARAPQEVGAAQAEPDWLKEVFQERFSPEQSAEVFSDYFRRTGKAPTADEIGLYRTRSTQRFAGRVVEPSYTPPWTREEKGERPQARELGPRGGTGGGAGPFGRTR